MGVDRNYSLAIQTYCLLHGVVHCLIFGLFVHVLNYLAMLPFMVDIRRFIRALVHYGPEVLMLQLVIMHTVIQLY